MRVRTHRDLAKFSLNAQNELRAQATNVTGDWIRYAARAEIIRHVASDRE